MMNRFIIFCVPLFIALLFTAGCSERESPVSPPDINSLHKAIITQFTFSHYPVQLTGEGEIKLVGQTWIFKDVGVIEQFISTDTLVSGTMHHYLSATIKASTGEGPVRGYWIVTPTANTGGVWKGNYTGYRSKMPGSDTLYTLPLKAFGHGEGGIINNMQIHVNTIMTAWGTPPLGWYGSGEGYYKGH